MHRGIVVTSVGRSGTSIIAELVHRWGAYPGDEQELQAGDEKNPQGYWEYVPLLKFNHKLLTSVGAHLLLPPPNDEILNKRAWEPEYRERALQLLDAVQSGQRVWFWKDPRLSMLLPFWEQIWKDVVYVIPVRNPLDIALSQQKWTNEEVKVDNFPFSTSLLYWQCLMLSILKYTETSRSKIFLEYESLIQDPLKECGRLCDFLDTECGCDHNSAQRIENMAQAVNSNLRRNRNTVPFSVVPYATQEQKALYRFLKKKLTNGDEKFNQDSFALPMGWRDQLQRVLTNLGIFVA